MRRTWLFVLCFLLFSASSLAQSTSSESQGMQALVAEVRQLRKDLQASNGYALKAQLLLYRLQIQDHRRAVAATLKRTEEFADNSDASAADRKEVQREISRLKAELENLAGEEQQRQTAEMEANEQLRTEQAKLSGLEERVDRQEKRSEEHTS